MPSSASRTLTCLLLLIAAGCSSARSGQAVANELDSAMGYFKTRLNQDEAMEAYHIYEAMKAIDPDYPGLEAAAQAFRDENTDLVDYFDRGWIGSNFSLRMPTDRGIGPEDEQTGIGHKILWYLPDRILDIFDIVSFDLHFGPGLYVDAHATRIAKVDLGVRSVAGVGWHDHRSLGVLTQADAVAGALPLGVRGYSATQAGTSGVQSGSWSVAGAHTPSGDIYKEFVDYWAVGASVTAAIVGVSVDAHPVEMIDMLVGFATFDPGNDDFGRTRGNRMTSHENDLIKTLGSIRQNDDEMANYANYLAGQDAAKQNTDLDEDLDAVDQG